MLFSSLLALLGAACLGIATFPLFTLFFSLLFFRHETIPRQMLLGIFLVVGSVIVLVTV